MAVASTLVANVASSYFTLRELDLELEISRRTLNSRKESLKLTKLLEERGVNSKLDVRQAEQLVYTAATQIPDLERRFEQLFTPHKVKMATVGYPRNCADATVHHIRWADNVGTCRRLGQCRGGSKKASDQG